AAALSGKVSAKTNVNGIATFSDLRVDTAGTYTLSANAPSAGIPAITSTAFHVSGAAPQPCVTPTFTNFPVGAATTPSAIAAADFDGNGLRDVAAASGTNVLVFSNSGGTFTQTATIPLGLPAVALAAADMDGDGRPDLIVATGTPFGLRVLTNTPAG